MLEKALGPGEAAADRKQHHAAGSPKAHFVPPAAGALQWLQEPCSCSNTPKINYGDIPRDAPKSFKGGDFRNTPFPGAARFAGLYCSPQAGVLAVPLLCKPFCPGPSVVLSLVTWGHPQMLSGRCFSSGTQMPAGTGVAQRLAMGRDFWPQLHGTTPLQRVMLWVVLTWLSRTELTLKVFPRRLHSFVNSLIQTPPGASAGVWPRAARGQEERFAAGLC